MATITDSSRPRSQALKLIRPSSALRRFRRRQQIGGSHSTNTVALYGNDLATFPDYPAEIRAPRVRSSGSQRFPRFNFLRVTPFTPGDAVDVLVAMNPAALKTNVRDLKRMAS